MSNVAGSMLAPGTMVAGYRVETLIGRGGMGAVYRASEEGLGRKVALKVIAPELASDERFRERFLRESRIAASLEHPHVVPIHGAGEDEDVLFLAMRYVEGTDLATLLAAEGPLEPERALSLLSQVAEALDAAHAKGLIHRDVKPSNVLIAEAAGSDSCYLADFGLTKRTGSDSAISTPDAIVGTLEYIAPEQITGEPLDARADVYSLGCVLYECLTGRVPFPRSTDVALLWAHVNEGPPPPSSVRPDLPAELDAVLARALAKDPRERFASAGELLEACSEPDAIVMPTAGRGSQTNLPRPLSSFVGREEELAEVRSLIESGARLVTLTGPGGTGKTRLALEAARSLAAAFENGVFWVGLASLRDPTLVTATIAQTLGGKGDLAEYIGERGLLLLLDNLEQVIDAAADLSSLLGHCPNLTLLVTSRELLRIQGEVEYTVPPLAEPEAVSLFCERSRLEPSGEIAELCARLDNLPLAVELAAARTKAMSPAQILERLSERLDLFKGGRDADPRQQTLRATIEWSYDLLSEEEQRLFRRLSVFAGGCTLEAAEEICDADLDTLQSLVQKSLLRFASERYWMLATIREYATDKLAGLGERDALRGRHTAHYFDLARRAELELRGADQIVWLEKAKAEHENLRAALDWSQERGDHEAALRAALALRRFWDMYATVDEAQRRFQGLLSVPQPPDLRALALRDLGSAALRQGDYERARALMEERLPFYRMLEDDVGVHRTLAILGMIATKEGDLDRARALLDRAVEWARGVSERELAAPLMNLSEVAWRVGELDAAGALFEECVSVNERLGDELMVGAACMYLGLVRMDQGDLARALPVLRRGFELAGRAPPPELTATLPVVANVAAATGEAGTAARLIGFVDRLRDEIGESSAAWPGGPTERVRATVMDVLGGEAFQAAYDDGQALSTDAALALAREVLDALELP